MTEEQCFSSPIDSLRLTDQNTSVDPQKARNLPCPFQTSRLSIDCFASAITQVPHACPRPKMLGMRVASSLQSDQLALRISFQTVAEPDAPISRHACNVAAVPGEWAVLGIIQTQFLQASPALRVGSSSLLLSLRLPMFHAIPQS